MKRYIKSAVALLLMIVIVLSVTLPALAAGQPSKYSTSRNSGERDVVCTTLSGTSASSYYTGSYSYDKLDDLSSSALLSTLRTLTKSTHKKTTSYSECKSYADETDCENGGSKLVTLYTSYTTSYTGSINREHVWPKSLGNYETSGPGADLHHIRPTESTPNSNRGNLRYGEVSGGKTSIGNASGYEAGKYGSYFEPLDNAKGDVARICLYMYVRYGGESQYTCSNITKVFQSVDVLLEWCELDPVDTWEMGRNEVIANIQGNRNVFIDYPELAWLLFDRDIPKDMTTPSGKAGSSVGGGGSDTDDKDCTHSNTELRAKVEATCGTAGYTGDTYCADCGKKLSSGSAIAATGNHLHTEIRNKVTPSCGRWGNSGDTYCTDCGLKIASGKRLVPVGAHRWDEGVITVQPTETTEGEIKYTCTVCGATSTVALPATGGGDLPDDPISPDDGTVVLPPDDPTVPDDENTPPVTDEPDGEEKPTGAIFEAISKMENSEDRLIILIQLGMINGIYYDMVSDYVGE